MHSVQVKVAHNSGTSGMKFAGAMEENAGVCNVQVPVVLALLPLDSVVQGSAKQHFSPPPDKKNLTSVL